VQPISALEALEARQLLSLTIDLRLAGGGKEITVDHIGQVVDLEAWAIVKGDNASITDDGMQTLVGSFLSSNVIGSGSVRGTLDAVPASPFDANGSQTAQQIDLDGDGDLDAGSNNDITAAGFFASRSGTPTVNGAPAAGGGAEFKIADVSFTVTSLLSASGETDVNFRKRGSAGSQLTIISALWREDGVAVLKNNINGTLLVGTPVVVHSTGGTASTGSIAGVVFNDADQSAMQDAGEAGLSGWIVFLDTDQDGKLGAGEVSTTTDANGAYSFTDLAPGTYHVAQVKQPGYAQVLPVDSEYTFALVASENRSSVNFANSTQGFIRGVIYDDANHNGQRDAGEAGLAGRQAFIDLNHDGEHQDNEVASTTSDVQGNYIFGPLPAGQYDVRPWVNVVGSYLPASRLITLPASTGLSGQDFGESSLEGSMGGQVINDANGNGELDPGEESDGIQGVRLWMDSNNNGALDLGERTVLSQLSVGVYYFNALSPGTYTIRIQVPAGYRLTSPASGKFVVSITGQHDAFGDLNFLLAPSGSIAGSVYDDANANGVRDSAEKGLANWGVYLDANKNALFDNGEKTATTHSSGNYKFTGLAAGSYRVRELLYADYRRVTPDAGFYDVSLSAGGSITGILFGNTKLGFIKGNVFKDTNGNGQRDAGEIGLAGFRVFDDTDGDGILDSNEQSTLTDANGNYTLNVASGWHTIRVQPKAGYRWSGILYYKVLTGFSTRVYDRNFGEKPIV
jgi:hypothetical protein